MWAVSAAGSQRRELYSINDPNFAEDGGQVTLHSAFSDCQVARDVLVAFTLADQMAAS